VPENAEAQFPMPRQNTRPWLGSGGEETWLQSAGADSSSIAEPSAFDTAPFGTHLPGVGLDDMGLAPAEGHASASGAAAASEEVNVQKKTKNARFRPPKCKRVQGKLIADRFFRAQMADLSDEQRELAEQDFLEATRDDAQLYEYTQQVLRSLNNEARQREANGADPMLTSVHI